MRKKRLADEQSAGSRCEETFNTELRSAVFCRHEDAKSIKRLRLGPLLCTSETIMFMNNFYMVATHTKKGFAHRTDYT